MSRLDQATISAAPEPGQLVTVRGRRWVASDVRAGAVEDDPLRPGLPAQHLVTLSSVEDDGLGEEMRVIWEIEPGAAAVSARGLPPLTQFEDPAKLDAFLLAVRWGAISSAEYKALQAPFRSGIEIEDYQLDPLVRAVQMPRVSLLIADDVGLGKTIETGLVIQEFLTRHRARSVLVICPASLQIQWRDQMRDRFGLEFRIVDSEMMRELRRRRGIHVNPWKHFPRLITSMDFIKRERPLRLMREVLPAEGESAYPRRFDILVIDEAHNVAPSGRGQYALDSLRTQTVRYLAPHFEHKMFLTATPHNGYRESFTALLELLDSQRFAVELEPDEKQLRAVMVRRLKTELPPRADGSPRFPNRALAAIKVPYTTEERRIHTLLQEYQAIRREGGSEGGLAADFVLKLLKKRLFSCPIAFMTTMKKHEETLRVAKKARKSISKKSAATVLKSRAEDIEEDSLDETERQEALEEALDVAAEQFVTTGEAEKRAREIRREMIAWAETHAARPDSKAQKLIDWLEKEIRPGGKWGKRRVIIFTEYLDTLKWLHQLLAARGFTADGRLETIHGGMDSDDREHIKAAFQSDPEESAVRILLATDAASEGIDLQNHCSRLIHYEIPWNPNRMEQRNGRVDRYGQREKEVQIFHFVDTTFKDGTTPADTKPGDLAGDLEFLYRAVLKLDAMERDLFGKVAPVVADQVEEAMLGRRRALDTSQAEKDAQPVRQLLKYERDIKKEIERLKDRLEDAKKELSISPTNVKVVVDTALALAGQPPLQPASLKGSNGPVLSMPALHGSWAPCTEGLKHPHTEALRPITFDGEVARGRDDVVLVHLNHRLVQMSLRLLRAEIWSDGSGRRLKRFTARLVPDKHLAAPSVALMARLVFMGRDGRRLHEEVISAGGAVAEGGFKRLAGGQLEDALEHATAQPAKASAEYLKRAWSRFEPLVLKALDTRRDERAESLSRTLKERAAKEIRDSETVLRELQKAIVQQLDEFKKPLQLELYGEEHDQRDRNKERLVKRLLEIPIEIEQEKKLIEARFRDPKVLVFPAAVVFLVPKSAEAEATAGGSR